MNKIEIICAVVGTAIAMGAVVVGCIKYLIKNAAENAVKSHRLTQTEEKVNNLPCTENSVNIQRLTTIAENIEKGECEKTITLNKLAKDIFILKTAIGSNGVLTEAHSPISLTDKGRTTAAEMNIENVIDRNWEQIKIYIDANIESNTAYDIQQLCIETATAFPSELFTDEDMQGIKNYAYLQGKSIAFYGSMIGVIIRDRYFSEKGLKIDDIDNNKKPIRKSEML